jgi:D-sedoheptulose 7-phosphate isomerase
MTTLTLTPVEQEIRDGMLSRRPDLQGCVDDLLRLHEVLVRCYDGGGKLLLCGNGGSNADAMHIAGELCKSFERKRPVPAEMASRLKGLPFGEELAQHLEVGLAAIPLGFQGSLKTAVENDCALRDIAFAQEAYALLRPGDVLLGISTSGNASNCLMAMAVAKAVGATAVSLTGPKGGKMAELADIALKAPGDSTKVVQEAHLVLYHTFCAMIEAHYFPEKR